MCIECWRTEDWDADQAVVHGPVDEDLEGTPAVDRYGVTGTEEISGEPLDVALAQEEPDDAVPPRVDDEWLLVEHADDCGRIVFHGSDGHGPEELALHLERP